MTRTIFEIPADPNGLKPSCADKVVEPTPGSVAPVPTTVLGTEVLFHPPEPMPVKLPPVPVGAVA